MHQYYGRFITRPHHDSGYFSGIDRIKKICITGLCFFCVVIAIIVNIKPVQALVDDTPRDSICKIFIQVQAFMVIEFFCKVMPDFMRQDKFNIFSFAGYDNLVAHFRKYLALFYGSFFVAGSFRNNFFRFTGFKLRDKSQYHIFPFDFIVFFPNFAFKYPFVGIWYY